MNNIKVGKIMKAFKKVTGYLTKGILSWLFVLLVSFLAFESHSWVSYWIAHLPPISVAYVTSGLLHMLVLILIFSRR